MSFQKFVQRSTKGVFLGIAILMVIPLVLWGYMGRGTPDREAAEVAGVLYPRTPQAVSISRAEFLIAKRHAYPMWWWRKMTEDRYFLMMMRYRRPEPPKNEEIEKIAWQDILLLHEAQRRHLTVSETEVMLRLREICGMFTREPVSDRVVDMVGQQFFQAARTDFEGWAQDLVLIDKLLSLVSDGEFAKYDDVFDQVLRQQQSAKVWYAAFDPKDFVRDVKPPTTDQIAKYYEEHKANFKIAEKVKIAYLMADYEELKKKAPEPGDEEVAKYYKEHPAEFQKPEPEHVHHPGDVHPEKPSIPETKPLSEVRGEIPGRIKQKWAEREAQDLMKRVDTELGALAVANQGKYPENAFDELKKKFAQEGPALVHDVTPAFDRKHVDDVEKLVGGNSDLATWAFDAKRAVGDISNQVGTSKGRAIFRLLDKKPAYDPGVTENVRAAIVEELKKEQLQGRARALAQSVVQEIAAHGFSAARQKYPADWRCTRYFKTQGGETGLDDQALSRAIASQVSGPLQKPGTATVLSANTFTSGDKKDWSYVLYLEDLVGGPPDDLEAQFANARREKDAELRMTYRQDYVKKLELEAQTETKKGSSSTPVPAGGPAEDIP
jgi:hypothetical protein